MSEGSIELICGCMFSGKTQELIRRINTYAASSSWVALKPAIDRRYSPKDIVSHDGDVLRADAVRSAADISERLGNATVLAIDELHFFDESIVGVLSELARRGTKIMCSGLDRDMWGREFVHVHELRRIARTTVLLATCNVCGQPADRTQRLIPLEDDNLVGGSEAFAPRCQRCFTPPNEPKPAGDIPGLAD